MRITIRYKLPHWTIWNEVTLYDAAEADRWVASLHSEGFLVERF